jgi:uncharacterized delta-60 repeat protein
LRVALVSSVAGFALLVLSPLALAAAGELDSTFDGDGRVTLDLGAADESAVDVAVQPDGKIVVLGTTGMSAVLARYTSTGALDTTFDGDGFLVFSSLHPSALALQPDGKIVVAGTANADFANADFALARFNDDGTPDASFDGDGLASADFVNHSNDIGRGVALQPDGKIVVAGSSDANHELGTVTVARFKDDGTLDDSFYNQGFRGWCCMSSYATAVAIQTNGKIVVAGSTGVFSHTPRFFVARLKPDGTRDSSFSSDGQLQTRFGAEAQGLDVAVQADGRVVVAGSVGAFRHSDFALARYTSSGRLDTTFSGDGKRRMDFSGGADEALGLVIQPNGRIVAAGFAAPLHHPSDSDFGLARYRSNGSLDLSFSVNGKQRVRFGSNDQDSAFAVARQAGGKLVVAGQATLTPGLTDLGLARLLGS